MSELRPYIPGSLWVFGLLALLVLATNAPGYCPGIEEKTQSQSVGAAHSAASSPTRTAGGAMLPWQWEFAATQQQGVAW